MMVDGSGLELFTDEVLKNEFKITATFHRNKILQGIKQLKLNDQVDFVEEDFDKLKLDDDQQLYKPIVLQRQKTGGKCDNEFCGLENLTSSGLNE